MMTSEPRSCFVFIHLPSGEQALCGRFNQQPVPGGGWRGEFVYARSYRERSDALELDPFELPLAAGGFEIVGEVGMFGAIRDAAPDAWGRRVIEWRLGGGALPSEVDYLLESPEDRAGALSFAATKEPPAPRHFHGVLDLERLLEAATTIDRGVRPAHLSQLLDPGTSMGGARPKTVVQDQGALWLAKFPTTSDRWNVSAVEAAMLDLAGECGIRVAEHRLVEVAGRSVLLVKRFDRIAHPSGSLRHARLVSARTVLRAGDGVTERAAWSYLRLADELQRWVVDPRGDRRELFRRMTFNALISNLDDHPRNHALIAPGREWMLSPAYDLTPTPAHSTDRRDLALEVGRQGRWANRGNILSESERFGFGAPEAGSLIDELKACVSTRWKALVRQRGGTPADVEAIAPAFDYPGFEYD